MWRLDRADLGFINRTFAVNQRRAGQAARRAAPGEVAGRLRLLPAVLISSFSLINNNTAARRRQALNTPGSVEQLRGLCKFIGDRRITYAL